MPVKKNALGNNSYFDLKMGLGGAIAMGLIVFFINWDHGIVPGLIAATKQATYTFLAGGFMMRLTENLASNYSSDVISILIAVLVPTFIAITLTYIVHSAKGTPEPLNSTIPTMILAPMGFLWWALRKRRQLKKQKSEL